MRIALCSDEQGGEHYTIWLRREDLPKLKALDFRPVYGRDHYEDGMETWQGPLVNMDEALALTKGQNK